MASGARHIASRAGLGLALIGTVARSGMAAPVPKAAESPSPRPAPPPAIATLLKPEVLKRVRDREVWAHARLEDVPGRPGWQRYSFYAVMNVDASVKRTRRILTDYSLYPKMVSYVDEAQFSARTRILRLSGGIWHWKLLSWLKFEEKSDRWIHFTFVAGHFQGLEGDILFEADSSAGGPGSAPGSPGGGRGTLVYLRGAQDGTHFPPAFVIERGAEIVFGFTAKRMRDYIEDLKNGDPGGVVDGGEVPKPRSHI